MTLATVQNEILTWALFIIFLVGVGRFLRAEVGNEIAVLARFLLRLVQPALGSKRRQPTSVASNELEP